MTSRKQQIANLYNIHTAYTALNFVTAPPVHKPVIDDNFRTALLATKNVYMIELRRLVRQLRNDINLTIVEIESRLTHRRLPGELNVQHRALDKVKNQLAHLSKGPETLEMVRELADLFDTASDLLHEATPSAYL